MRSQRGGYRRSDEWRGRQGGVTCVDALALRADRPARTLNGWELKCYALLNSRFREALLLDADNVAVADPTPLFEAPEYRRHGAVFWPDYGRLAPGRGIWRLTGVAHRDEPEFESGQILLDKQRCWEPLNLAMWMNEHSDFWYRHVHGDKDTFHLAWRKLGAEYAMPAAPIHPLFLAGRSDGVMCQHDFSGRRLFQHRNFGKWSVDGENPRIPDFWLEDECLQWLRQLGKAWATRPSRPYCNDLASHDQRRVARTVCGRRWTYRRLGRDQRPMTFALDGRIVGGAAGCERTWNIHPLLGRHALSIHGNDGLTCVLLPNGENTWHGRWLIHERMPVDLVSTGGPILDTEPSRNP